MDRQVIDQRIVDLQEAVNILITTQTYLDDWSGPAGTKLNHAYSYLREQLYPLIESLLSDPEQTQRPPMAADEFVGEIGPLPNCAVCGLAIMACGCHTFASEARQ